MKLKRNELNAARMRALQVNTSTLLRQREKNSVSNWITAVESIHIYNILSPRTHQHIASALRARGFLIYFSSPNWIFDIGCVCFFSYAKGSSLNRGKPHTHTRTRTIIYFHLRTISGYISLLIPSSLPVPLMCKAIHSNIFLLMAILFIVYNRMNLCTESTHFNFLTSALNYYDGEWYVLASRRSM